MPILWPVVKAKRYRISERNAFFTIWKYHIFPMYPA